MNIRRGMFRLWVVASILFVLSTALVSYPQVRGEFARATPEGDWFDQFTRLPTKCSVETRGAKDVDYEEEGEHCWYPMEKFRALYPEYKDLGNLALADALYAKIGSPREPARPWRLVTLRTAVAPRVPLAFLALGWSFGWALVGFKETLR